MSKVSHNCLGLPSSTPYGPAIPAVAANTSREFYFRLANMAVKQEIYLHSAGTGGSGLYASSHNKPTNDPG